MLRHYLLFSLMLVGFLVLVPTAPAVPTLPTINTANIVNITNASFGATSSTTLTNTAAIQAAINFAAATNGGATVEIPAGTYLSGPLTLKSKVNLQIDTNATLLMLPMGAWPNASTPFILGSSISDVEISGSGTIDGNTGFGSSDWWGPVNGSPVSTRPNFIQFTSCNRILIQDVTLRNPPTFHVMIKNNNQNITVQHITINTPGDSPNTDGFDIGSTSLLIQNCSISDGDDNLEIGGSSALAANIVVTNCTFGTGHGVSIGGFCQAGISNLTVINCTNIGTDNGIRMKSDYDRGGLVQNLSYLNMDMTNVRFPVLIYSYYSSVGTPDKITPQVAAATNAATITTTPPIWRNITISNLTVTGGTNCVIWARTELPATNIVFNHVNISTPRSFEIYNARGIQFVDSKITTPATINTFTLYNAGLIVTNSTFVTNLVTIDGLTTNGYGNTLALYKARASLKNTNVFDHGPLTMADSTLIISNNFMLFPSTVLNFTLDPNTNRVAVVGNLTLGGTINLTNGPGFGPGTNTLLTYTGTLSGNLPALGATPGLGYTYVFDTNTAGQVNLIVASPAPAAPTNFTATATNLLINLKWNGVAGAASYNLKRGTVNTGPYPTVYSGLVVTNYSDAAVTNAVTYYYVVTAVAGGESTNSLQAGAAPLPSLTPINIILQPLNNGQLPLSWPQDHLGWHLQIQTNNSSAGLGANWVNLSGSAATNRVFIPIDLNNGSVFLRLTYP